MKCKNTNRLGNIGIKRNFEELIVRINKAIEQTMEYKTLNPSDFGLNSRVVLVQISQNHIGIVKKRKSRIIMKDGIQISLLASQINNKLPQARFSLLITGPICSKTIKFLDNESISIIRAD